MSQTQPRKLSFDAACEQLLNKGIPPLSRTHSTVAKIFNLPDAPKEHGVQESPGRIVSRAIADQTRNRIEQLLKPFEESPTITKAIIDSTLERVRQLPTVEDMEKGVVNGACEQIYFVVSEALWKAMRKRYRGNMENLEISPEVRSDFEAKLYEEKNLWSGGLNEYAVERYVQGAFQL